ncbi:hypothetical protein ES319_D10G285000v1 [Gossypium barbadense]|uniref:TF-B3 domain-containing protein n=2 Tax=Gossypium TaxID=3633 RepID=A0A5J5PYE8_GOSBA|nr:hypothetical protein ES319_D10G285000v1 [Gossypium barbadense]PPD76987.1 hypothetical protein GOBAR_DD26087 [Gossypium barbadense]TYG51965.1 hypothetical protein ES288_D10G303600v1 [Gossypium darwinii]
MTILFSKVLTNTDVEKRLAVPNNSLKHFELENGNCSKSVEVKDENDGAYKKPVLSSGWRQFVVNKGVHQGDLITFCKDVEAEATYKIIVQRKIKLLGKEFWCSPEPEQPTDATAQVIQAPADATGEVIQSLAVLPDV